VWRRDSQTGTEVALKLVNSAVPARLLPNPRRTRVQQLMRVGSHGSLLSSIVATADERLYVAMELSRRIACERVAGWSVDLETAKTWSAVGQALLEAQRPVWSIANVSPGTSWLVRPVT